MHCFLISLFYALYAALTKLNFQGRYAFAIKISEAKISEFDRKYVLQRVRQNAWKTNRVKK